MNHSRNKVLVTGADGFIGSHLAESLVNLGYSVKALAQYNSFNNWGWLDQLSSDVKNQIEVAVGDIRDPHWVVECVDECKIIYHLAALIAIPYSYRSPDSYVGTNIQGTLNLLQASKKVGIEKFIHTSTSEVYGTAQSVPISEKHPLSAQSPYAATKVAADQLALSFYRSYDLPVAILRPFNTYGPRQSARAIIPTIITQIAAGRRELRLGSLTPTRDFIYVGETVRGFIQVAQSKKAMGEVVNICSGYEISIGDLAKLIAKLMNTEVEIISDQQRMRPTRSEVERLLGDNTKAATLIGWEPKNGGEHGLIEGLKQTIDWFTQDKNLQCYKADLYNV